MKLHFTVFSSTFLKLRRYNYVNKLSAYWITVQRICNTVNYYWCWNNQQTNKNKALIAIKRSESEGVEQTYITNSYLVKSGVLPHNCVSWWRVLKKPRPLSLLLALNIANVCCKLQLSQIWPKTSWGQNFSRISASTRAGIEIRYIPSQISNPISTPNLELICPKS